MTIATDILRRMSALGQEGIEKLDTLEKAIALLPAGAESDAVKAAVADLHSFGGTAYKELGLSLKTQATFRNRPGEVLLLSGGTDK